MSARETVSFEIYLLVRGRWEIHARHDFEHRDDAIAEAQQLEREPHVTSACVVREIYDPVENVSNESVVYYTDTMSVPPSVDKLLSSKGESAGKEGKGAATKGTAKKRAARKASRRVAAAPRQPSAPPSPVRPKVQGRRPPPRGGVKPRGERQKTSGALLMRLLVAFLLSALGGTMVGLLGIFVLRKAAEAGVVFERNTAQGILVLCFALSFLLFFTPMIRQFLRRSRPAQQEVQPMPAPMPQPLSIPEPVPVVAEPQEQAPEPEPEAQEEQPPLSEEEIQAILDREADRRRELEAQQEAEEAARKAAEQAPPEAEQAKQADQAAGPLGKVAAEVNNQLLRFIGYALTPVAASGKVIDAFNRFGLTLFFTGAGEYLGSRASLSRAQLVPILADRMQMLGHNAAMANAFCANIDEYLLNPKYLTMYDAGRTAMMDHLKDPQAEIKLDAALQAWNRRADTDGVDTKEFVAVLFTDIVGSTAMGQKLGDAGGMEVVRAHNQIVREALTMFGGKEIKHMGDGIMAVFPVVHAAVQAGVRIQQRVARHNADTTPTFYLRIGVNAGEPIREGGDFFGTPVQLAARVMSVADADEIAVSNVVRDLCVGKDLQFDLMGEFELKGFREAITVYKVAWRGPAGAKAPAPAAASGANGPVA